MKSKKVGMFGGTFNPFHSGHINCIKEAKKILGLDLVFVIPAYKNPLKPIILSPTPDQRFEITKIACQDFDFIKVDNRDIKRKTDSFTITSLNELKKTYNDLHLIMGADLFRCFPEWDDYQAITSQAKIAVATRPGFEIKNVSQITKVTLNDIDISASRIRSYVAKKDKLLHKYLNKNVIDFIYKNNLYS